MNDKRIPLKDYVTDDIVVAESSYNDWLWWGEISQTEKTPYEIVFIKPGKKAYIHYIEDYMVKVKYIVARGEQADKVVEEAKNSLDCYSWQEILNEYATSKNHKQKIQTIYIAGTAAPFEFNPEHKKFFDNSLQDEHPDVRIATIVAMGYMGWSEWIPVLEDLKNNDPDETVRDSAAGMLESFAANGVGDSNDSLKPDTTQEQNESENSPSVGLEQLQQELRSNKQKLTQLRTQLEKVEERIKQARRTNIFGRKQSGENERERDRLTQEIKDIKHRIAENESAIKALEE